MLKEEFECLKNKRTEDRLIFSSDFLSNFIFDKTLLYGYMPDRNTYHMYINSYENCIYMIIYNIDDIVLNYRKVCDEVYEYDIIPCGKRLYPECCDFLVCEKLKEKGYYLPFTNFNEERKYEKFYGKVITKDGVLKTYNGENICGY